MTGPRRLHICMVSPDPGAIERLQVDLSSHAQWGTDLVYGTCDDATLLLNLHRYDPDCFVLDLDLGVQQVQAMTATLKEAGYREFVFLGAKDNMINLPGEVLPAGAPVGSVVSAIRRTCAQSQPEMAGATSVQTGRHHPVIITVHSPKGGTGKTLLACSLATQYAAKGARALLLDLATYGGVAPSLGLPRREKGLVGVVEALENDPSVLESPAMLELLRRNLTAFPVGERRLDLLLAAPPLKMSKLTLEQTEVLVRWLASDPYDAIVIDTAGEISERTAVTLKVADFVLLVTVPELPAAWSLLTMQDLLRNLNTPGKVQVVVNRCGRGQKLRELEEIIGYPVVAQVPETARPWERAVGRNLSLDYSAFGLSLKQLAQRFHAVYGALEIPGMKR